MPFGGSGGHNSMATFARLRFAVLASNLVPSGSGTSRSVSLPAILQRRSTLSLRSFLGFGAFGGLGIVLLEVSRLRIDAFGSYALQRAWAWYLLEIFRCCSGVGRPTEECLYNQSLAL